MRTHNTGAISSNSTRVSNKNVIFEEGNGKPPHKSTSLETQNLVSGYFCARNRVCNAVNSSRSSTFRILDDKLYLAIILQPGSLYNHALEEMNPKKYCAYKNEDSFKRRLQTTLVNSPQNEVSSDNHANYEVLRLGARKNNEKHWALMRKVIRKNDLCLKV